MAFEVPPLPYDYRALEPHIDEETMRLHHDKHHQAYVDKANAALEGTEHANESPERILTILEELPEDKRTVGPQQPRRPRQPLALLEDHEPNGGGKPEGELARAIEDTFGGVDELKKAVNDAGVNRFGSGWTWLITTVRAWLWFRRQTRTHRSWAPTCRCSGSTSGSTPTT